MGAGFSCQTLNLPEDTDSCHKDTQATDPANKPELETTKNNNNKKKTPLESMNTFN